MIDHITDMIMLEIIHMFHHIIIIHHTDIQVLS